MARKLYDLAVKTGEYKNQSGEMKGRWQNVGACMQSDDGSKFLMLAKWFNPAGVQELIDYGLYGFALSRFAGTWAAIKCVKDNIESTASVDASPG